MSATEEHWQAQPPVVPSDIKLKRPEQVLIITWKADDVRTYTGEFLRKNCPCASCRTEREQQKSNPLHILTDVPDHEPRMESAQLMGNYAIKLIWSDGHDTGIFDYRYLHSLRRSNEGNK